MKALTTCLLLLGLFAGLLGCTWFLCLVLQLPPVIAPLLSLAAVAVLYRALHLQDRKQAYVPVSRVRWLLIAAGIFLVVNRCYHIAEIHGGWDAWAMWNHNAKILSDRIRWEPYLLGRNPGHADYPLLLPALNGMLMYFFGAGSQDIVSYPVALFATLSIVLLMFTALAPRSLFFAGLVLLWLATNDVFLFDGSSQYADTPLALFFLACLVCLDAKTPTLQERRIFDGLAGFFAGAAAFTKNEGLLFLAVVVVMFAVPLLRKKRFLFFLAGLILPIGCLITFRVGWPAGNDLMQGGGIGPLFNLPAWGVILSRLYELLCHQFLVLQIVLALVLIIAIYRRQWPSKAFFATLLLLAGYSAIYTLSPYSLDWHLSTSQSRLLHGLQPAMIYAAMAWMLGPERSDTPLLKQVGTNRVASAVSSIRAFLR